MPLSFSASTSACYWDPEDIFRRTGSYFPLCSQQGEYNAFSTLSGLSVHHVSKCTITLLYDLAPQTPKIIGVCGCPCDDLVEVETPSRIAMALSYIAQALVVTIVGLNMGFRYVRHCM